MDLLKIYKDLDLGPQNYLPLAFEWINLSVERLQFLYFNA